MSILRRPNFYLWTLTADVVRLERLHPSYELIAESTEQPDWKSTKEVARFCKSMMSQEDKHPVVSLLGYRRMFVRVDGGFHEANQEASRCLMAAMEKVGSLYAVIAKAEGLSMSCYPLGPQKHTWPMPIHFATSYWWP